MAGTDAASRLGLLKSLLLGDAYMHLIIPGLTGLERDWCPAIIKQIMTYHLMLISKPIQHVIKDILSCS